MDALAYALISGFREIVMRKKTIRRASTVLLCLAAIVSAIMCADMRPNLKCIPASCK